MILNFDLQNSLFRSERVAPIQPGKAREVTIGRSQPATVLRRKRGEMRIGDEIADSLCAAKHPGKLNAMSLRRADGADAGQIKPFLNVSQSLIER